MSQRAVGLWLEFTHGQRDHRKFSNCIELNFSSFDFKSKYDQDLYDENKSHMYEIMMVILLWLNEYFFF